MTRPALAKKKANLSRAYTHPVTGESVPSVTTVTSVKDKSGPLVGWAVKLTAQAGMQRITEIIDGLETDPDGTRAALRALYGTKKARAAAEREIKGARFEPAEGALFTAAQTGDLVHDAIETHVTTGRVGLSLSALSDLDRLEVSEAEAMDYIRPWVQSFLAFEQRWSPQWELAEATVWNRSLGYAGTMDLAGTIGGRRYLLDVKTGNGVYPEYAMQLQALAHGEFQLDKSGQEQPLPHFDAMAILHVRPEFWELHEVRPDPSAWVAFQSLLSFLNEEVNAGHNWLGTRVSGMNTNPNPERHNAA